jgi:hypothetical protein
MRREPDGLAVLAFFEAMVIGNSGVAGLVPTPVVQRRALSRAS